MTIYIHDAPAPIDADADAWPYLRDDAENPGALHFYPFERDAQWGTAWENGRWTIFHGDIKETIHHDGWSWVLTSGTTNEDALGALVWINANGAPGIT